MNWKKKYNINLEEVHEKNINGDSLVTLSKEYGIPKTTLGRYLLNAGYEIQMNGRNPFRPYLKSETDGEMAYDSRRWKQALIFHFGHKCRICGYDKIVEAHHIVPMNAGGLTSFKNGILLCPNRHAEVHANLLDLTDALVKLGELLGYPEEDNQKPSQSNVMSIVDWKAQRLTDEDSHPINLTRAPRSCSKRMTKEDYRDKFPLLRDMI
jgi:hypothetical protein